MKKIYLSLITIISASVAFAQAGYTISPSNDVQKLIVPTTYDYQQIDFAHDNSTADSIELNWQLINLNSPGAAEGWDYSYCDYVTCYAANATSGTMKKIGQNQTAFLKVNLMAADEGWAYFQFKVWQTGDEANTDTVSYTFHSSLGISDKEAGEKVQVYPNPSNGSTVNVNGVLPNSSISIVNSLGQVVESISASSKLAKLEGLDLRNGVYFVQLSRSGSIYATRKLIVK